MGFGELFNRSTQYQVTNTKSGVTESFTIVNDLAPDWSYGAYSGGMSIPGAWRAATLLSDLLGGVPWHAYRERGGNPPERIVPTPYLLEQPSPPDVRMTTFSSMALDLIWHGNAIAVIAGRDRSGWPTAFTPVPAARVQVRRTETWDDMDLPVGSVVYEIGRSKFSAYDVIHVKGPCEPGALRGMGVLESHLNGTLALAREQARQAHTIGTSGVPTGVLKSDDPDMEQSDADDLKAAWLKAQRTRTVAVLNANTTWESVAWNPSETQLLDARRFSLHEIALIFGMPLSFLGVGVEGGSMTYSNIEQESLNLIRYSLAGHLARFEQTLTSHLPRGTHAKANLDSLLRADTLTRYQAHEVGIRGGFLTADEARSLEDRPPLTAAQRAAQKATRSPLTADRPDRESQDPEDTTP